LQASPIENTRPDPTPPPTGTSARQSVSSRLIHVYVLRVEPMRAAGLQALFEDSGTLHVVVEDSADPGAKGWLDATVDLAVIGTQLGAGTLKLISAIRSARPTLPMLVMSPAAGDEAILSVLGLGAKGYLHEGATPAEFERAVRAIVAGMIWAPRRLQARLIERLLSSREASRTVSGFNFTAREQQVLELLLDGQSNREIAQTLEIEERTVKSYVAKLMGKTGVRNRTALSMQALSARGSHPQ
jgi:two-component system nitrate/nitrite response regulator NarL